MVKRSLYYWSKLYTSQMQEGMPYRALRKTITINLLDFILFSSDEEFQTTGQLWDTTKQRVLSDDIEIHFVEIPKLVKQWREEKVNQWENMSHYSSFRSAYEAREKLLLDEQAKLAHAREEGLEEGVEKGKLQLIRSMYENGMTLDDIAKFTGLNIEEIRRVIG